MRDHHSHPLCASEDLEDCRHFPDGRKSCAKIPTSAQKNCGGNTHTCVRKDLQTVHFVPALSDALTWVDDESALGLELSNHCQSVIGDRGSDARKDRVVLGQLRSVVEDALRSTLHDHLAFDRIDDIAFDTELLRLLKEAANAVKILVPGQDCDSHRDQR